jgi:hypothetical protein
MDAQSTVTGLRQEVTVLKGNCLRAQTATEEVRTLIQKTTKKEESANKEIAHSPATGVPESTFSRILKNVSALLSLKTEISNETAVAQAAATKQENKETDPARPVTDFDQRIGRMESMLERVL